MPKIANQPTGGALDKSKKIVIAIYLTLAFGGYFVSLMLSRLARIKEFLGL
jgi:hypothetical protein